MRTFYTDEEIEMLAANPYTAYVNETQLHFTAEFKELLWTRYKLGERLKEIFEDCGYDPELVGLKRIENTIARVRAAKRSNGTMTDGHKRSHQRKATDREYELEYLRQENAFLKKLYILETGKPYGPKK